MPTVVTHCVIQSRRLVIDVDGEHHQLLDRIAAGATRDDRLRSNGYRTLRMSTGELSDSFDGCINETRARELMEGAVR